MRMIGFTIRRTVNEVLGSISPCLRFSALPLIIRDFVVCAYRQRLQHELHAHTKMLRALELFKGARIYESRNSKMYFTLCHPSDIWDLSAELQYIPKIVYSYACTGITSNTSGTSFRNTWRQIRRKIRICRRGDEHYNHPWQRTHIDGSVLKTLANVGVGRIC